VLDKTETSMIKNDLNLSEKMTVTELNQEDQKQDFSARTSLNISLLEHQNK